MHLTSKIILDMVMFYKISLKWKGVTQIHGLLHGKTQHKACWMQKG